MPITLPAISRRQFLSAATAGAATCLARAAWGEDRVCDPNRFALLSDTHVVAFIEPPQGDVIEKILRHCGLWCPASPRAPPAGHGWIHDPDGNSEGDSASDQPRELTFVDEATFWATC